MSNFFSKIRQSITTLGETAVLINPLSQLLRTGLDGHPDFSIHMHTHERFSIGIQSFPASQDIRAISYDHRRHRWMVCSKDRVFLFTHDQHEPQTVFPLPFADDANSSKDEIDAAYLKQDDVYLFIVTKNRVVYCLDLDLGALLVNGSLHLSHSLMTCCMDLHTPQAYCVFDHALNVISLLNLSNGEMVEDLFTIPSTSPIVTLFSHPSKVGWLLILSASRHILVVDVFNKQVLCEQTSDHATYALWDASGDFFFTISPHAVDLWKLNQDEIEQIMLTAEKIQTIELPLFDAVVERMSVKYVFSSDHKRGYLVAMGTSIAAENVQFAQFRLEFSENNSPQLHHLEASDSLVSTIPSTRVEMDSWDILPESDHAIAVFLEEGHIRTTTKTLPSSMLRVTPLLLSLHSPISTISSGSVLAGIKTDLHDAFVSSIDAPLTLTTSTSSLSTTSHLPDDGTFNVIATVSWDQKIVLWTTALNPNIPGLTLMDLIDVKAYLSRATVNQVDLHLESQFMVVVAGPHVLLLRFFTQDEVDHHLLVCEEENQALLRAENESVTDIMAAMDQVVDEVAPALSGDIQGQPDIVVEANLHPDTASRHSRSRHASEHRPSVINEWSSRHEVTDGNNHIVVQRNGTMLEDKKILKVGWQPVLQAIHPGLVRMHAFSSWSGLMATLVGDTLLLLIDTKTGQEVWCRELEPSERVSTLRFELVCTSEHIKTALFVGMATGEVYMFIDTLVHGEHHVQAFLFVDQEPIHKPVVSTRILKQPWTAQSNSDNILIVAHEDMLCHFAFQIPEDTEPNYLQKNSSVPLLGSAKILEVSSAMCASPHSGSISRIQPHGSDDVLLVLTDHLHAQVYLLPALQCIYDQPLDFIPAHLQNAVDVQFTSNHQIMVRWNEHALLVQSFKVCRNLNHMRKNSKAMLHKSLDQLDSTMSDRHSTRQEWKQQEFQEIPSLPSLATPQKSQDALVNPMIAATMEREQKLKSLDSSLADMQSSSQLMAEQLREYNERQKKKNWWNF